MKGDMYVNADGILGFPDDIRHKLFFNIEISSINVSRSDLEYIPAMIDRVIGLCGKRLQEEFARYAEKRIREEDE